MNLTRKIRCLSNIHSDTCILLRMHILAPYKVLCSASLTSVHTRHFILWSLFRFLHPLKWNILYSNHSDGSQSIPALFYLKLNFLAWRVACCWENGFRCFSELFTSAVLKNKPAQCFDLLSLVLPFFFFYPKLVYWDGLPFILIQGAFSAASIWKSILL